MAYTKRVLTEYGYDFMQDSFHSDALYTHNLFVTTNWPMYLNTNKFSFMKRLSIQRSRNIT